MLGLSRDCRWETLLSCELDVTDCFGNPVRLDHANCVNHVEKRPEIGPHHDVIADVLTDPDIVVSRQREGIAHYHFYRRDMLAGRSASLYLRVIVRYPGDGARGVVVTAWLTSSVDLAGGELKWLRPR